MNLRLISPDSWVRQPWRNGGGVTAEVLREGGEPFHLRVSVADVRADGPFSPFPGVDRVIVLIEGRGFELGEGPEVVRLDQIGASYAFAGERAPACRLVDGPVRDLNFMVDRRRFTLNVLPASDPEAGARNGRHLVFALADGVEVIGPDGSARLARHDLLDTGLLDMGLLDMGPLDSGRLDTGLLDGGLGRIQVVGPAVVACVARRA